MCVFSIVVKIHFESVLLSLIFRLESQELYSFNSFHFCCNKFTLWIASVKGKFEQKKGTMFKEEKLAVQKYKSIYIS